MDHIELERLWAVIGIWIDGQRAYYVRRSNQMLNYPGVWSLFSIQFPEGAISDPADIDEVQPFMQCMANERLQGAPIRTLRLLVSDNSSRNPINKHVFLHLYEISLSEPPQLNPVFYSASRWMTFDEYEDASADLPCGLCTRMWGDYAYLHGVIDHPFLPRKGNS